MLPLPTSFAILNPHHTDSQLQLLRLDSQSLSWSDPHFPSSAAFPPGCRRTPSNLAVKRSCPLRKPPRLSHTLYGLLVVLLSLFSPVSGSKDQQSSSSNCPLHLLS